MIKKILLLSIGILLISAEGKSEEIISSSSFLSFRALGITRHLVDVSNNATYFPLKISKNASTIINPGLLISFDKPINNGDLYWRTVQSLYIDCAIQPAGYFGTMFFRNPIIRYKNISTGFGFGLGIDIRRSWQKYVDKGIETRFLNDWNSVEGIIGPYSEIELAFMMKNNKQFVLNVVPAFPALIFISAGIKVRV